jgi:hypothetical protein
MIFSWELVVGFCSIFATKLFLVTYTTIAFYFKKTIFLILVLFIFLLKIGNLFKFFLLKKISKSKQYKDVSFLFLVNKSPFFYALTFRQNIK